MPSLLAEIDGQTYPLDECDWVLWDTCGCPITILVASLEGDVLAATEEQAWAQCGYTKRQAFAAKRRGQQVELLPHRRYVTEVSEKFARACPHEESK